MFALTNNLKCSIIRTYRPRYNASLIGNLSQTSVNSSIRIRRLSWLTAKLDSRTVLEVKGPDAGDFLQGLITNDVRHLNDGQTHCINAFFLNHLGRILADVLVYKPSTDTLYIECDTSVANTVHKNLKLFKLKKKVSICVREDLNVTAIFPDTLKDNQTKIKDVVNDDALLVNDHRLPGFGLYRSLSTKELQISDVKCHLIQDIFESSQERYVQFRYENGLGEGSKDHLMGSSFPLESNGDYLNAISFFKGCYVGQELTARTYHTGVTRKRLMPVEFVNVNSDTTDLPAFEPEVKITGEDGKKRLGKLRSYSGSKGLALLYIDEVLKNEGSKLFIGTTQLKTWKPKWWPDKHINDQKIAI